ncbi:IclR family transcriptional regulator [Variovorax robiniae]|uniref:IclR family transcriptional regulator n=1 Tax=Variovorax robiniae TaxID=1836199 RepID=A0ABU8XFW8_9BURK
MPSIIPAVGRTMAAFEAFAREKRDLSNKDMARLLDLPDSSCLDLLHTLHSLGYLLRTPKSLRYYPTGRWYEMARQVNENDPMRRMAQEAVDVLAEKANETSFFGLLDQSGAKVVATQSTRLPLRLIVEIGERASLHGTALGKALLGALPQDQLEEWMQRIDLEPLASRTITSKRKFQKDVEAARERGWYETVDEGAEHVSALAVSGWIAGQPAAITLAGPTERIAKNHKSILRSLLEVREALLSNDDSA